MTNSNMTCAAFDELLSDYLEGTLDGSLRPAVEGHLRECVRCTGLVKDLRSIETDASKLPDLVPSRDLWQGIESRIAAPVIPLATRPERARRFAPTWMGIAAAALIVTTAGITYTLTARSFERANPSVAAGGSANATQTTNTPTNVDEPSAPQNVVVAAGTPVQAAPSVATGSRRPPSAVLAQPATASLVTQTIPSEAIYSREIAALQNIVNDRKTQLDSTTIAIIERNLRIIDFAIEQSKAALAKDPASKLLSDQLTRALDKKVELLRTAAMLPANT